MPAFYELFAASKAVIVACLINWNTMSARLKVFLDRTPFMQNLSQLKIPG
jgi:multimeric flavodoxin WrbA